MASKLVPVAITRVVTAEIDLGLGSIVVLTEVDGERSFPIFIGYFEAVAIDRHIKRLLPPRPLTHDLLANAISEMGGTVDRIVVSSLHDNTFYARIHVRRDIGESVEIDARPSDALALAVRTSARILVAGDVIEQAAL